MPAVILNIAGQPVARSSRSQMLRSAGYLVREAASGEEALDVISRENPVAVVLDVNLCGIDGFDLCRRIKRHSCIRSPRVLHITRSGNWQADYERSSASGAEACLAEPLDPAVFHHTIEWLITAPRFMDRSTGEDISHFLLDALPELWWTCRPDGWCDHIGRQWIEYTGVPETRQLGFGWLEAVHPDEREDLGRAWRASIAGQGKLVFEARIHRRDGVYRWFQFRGIAVRGSTGALVRWACSCADIEGRRQGEEALRRAAERLKSIDEELQQLRAIVARACSESSNEPSLGAAVSP